MQAQWNSFLKSLTLRPFDFLLLLICIATLGIALGLLEAGDDEPLAWALVGGVATTIPLVLYTAYERAGHEQRSNELRRRLQLVGSAEMTRLEAAFELGYIWVRDYESAEATRMKFAETLELDQAWMTGDRSDPAPMLTMLKRRNGEIFYKAFLLGFDLYRLDRMAKTFLSGDEWDAEEWEGYQDAVHSGLTTLALDKEVIAGVDAYFSRCQKLQTIPTGKSDYFELLERVIEGALLDRDNPPTRSLKKLVGDPFGSW